MNTDFDPDFDFDFSNIDLLALRNDSISMLDIQEIVLTSRWEKFDKVVRIAIGFNSKKMRFLKVAFSYDSNCLITIWQVALPDLEEIQFAICR